MSNEPEFFWTRTSGGSMQLICRSPSLVGKVVMAIFKTTGPDYQFQWMAYDPRKMNPVYTPFPSPAEAKQYCEVTARLCGT